MTQLSRRLRCSLWGADDRRLLFIACFPKSGSTYLMRLMHEITGFPRVQPVAALGANEQDFCEPQLTRIRFQDGVCHQHLKATKQNLALLRKHAIRPVILVRNIFDVVPSLGDHFHNESREFPTGFVPESFFSMTREDQWMFVIRVHIPWYFSFLMSWDEADDQLSARWLTYERLFGDTEHVVASLLEFWNVERFQDRVTPALNRMSQVNTRLNRGVSGRGRQLNAGHQDAIRRMADCCNLSVATRERIGL